MTTATIILVNIFFILSITLSFILGRKSVMNNTKKKLKRAHKKTKKVKAKVTSSKKATSSKTSSKMKKKQIIDLDPNNYIQNLSKEALETSNDIKEMTEKK